MRPPARHLITAAVAAAAFGAALADGGYPLGFVAGAAFALWWVVLLCVGLRLLPRATVPTAAVVAGACLAALMGWTALSLAWASDDGAAFVEIVRVSSFLALFVLVVLLSEDEGPRPWLAGLALGLSAAVLLGLLSRFVPSIEGDHALGARLSYPIGYWNGLGACAALASTSLLWLAVNARQRWQRAAAAAAIPLHALAVFLSASRGSVIAAAVGAIAVVALDPRRAVAVTNALLAAAAAALLIAVADGQAALVAGRADSEAFRDGRLLLAASALVVGAVAWARSALDQRLTSVRVRWRWRRLALVALVPAAVAVVIAIDPVERFEEFKRSPRVAAAQGELSSDGLARGLNGSGRYQFWDAALEAFEQQPLHGIGAGQYEQWWNQHGSIYWVLRDAHSLLFEQLAELGAIGLALVLVFFGVCVASGWRCRAGPFGVEAGGVLALFLAGVTAASIDWMWEFPLIFGVVVAAAALLTGSATRKPAAGPSTRPGPWLGIATMAVATVSLVCSADLLLTRVSLNASRSAFSEGNLAPATDAARDAIALQPWAAPPRLQLGLLLEASGDVVGARSALRAAEERAPEDWRALYVLGRIEREAGRDTAARAALAAARSLNPRSPLLRRGPR